METKDTNQQVQYTTFTELKSNVLSVLRHNIEYLQDCLLRCPPPLSPPYQMALEQQLAHLLRVQNATTLAQLWMDSEEKPSFLEAP
jgi:hypothetical protein